mgnify:CR=1 FL=1
MKGFFPSRTVALYMARLFLTRTFGILAGLVLVLQALDLLSESGKILSVAGNGDAEVWRYVGLRLPQIVSTFLPFSVLLGTILTLITMNANSEVIALKAAGLSAHQLLAPLILASLGVGLQVLPETGRDLILWPGVCIVHEAFSETELLKLKAQYPGAPVAAHPECPAVILDHADYVGSTRGILDYAMAMPGDTLIVATEPHIIHQMEKAVPTKRFIGAPGADGNCNCNICPYMALNTLEKLAGALRTLTPRIEIEEGLRLQAKKSLDKMLEMASATVGQGDLGTR